MFRAGVDIIEIKRFSQIKYPERVCDFFLSSAEKKELEKRIDKLQYMASRFAAKEAIIKAIPEPIGFLDFEITKQNTPGPVAHFLQKKYYKYTVSVSLSHSFDYVAGFALVTY